MKVLVTGAFKDLDKLSKLEPSITLSVTIYFKSLLQVFLIVYVYGDVLRPSLSLIGTAFKLEMLPVSVSEELKHPEEI